MKRIPTFTLLLFFILASATTTLKAQTWNSDQVHSTVMYTIRHQLTPMVGIFKKFHVAMEFDATKPLATTITATLDASSVMMGNEGLETHLKAEDFFDVAHYPEWSFKSTGITPDKKSKTKTRFFAAGELTVRGVTKSVSIPFEVLGTKEGERGQKAGFSAEFTIQRLDYGVGQGEYTNTNGLGNDVKITVLLDMNRKK